MDVVLKHTFLGGVFSRNFFPRDVFLVNNFLRDEFEGPLARTSFSGRCLGCLLDAV